MKLFRYTLSFASATFLSRILGFFRDAVIAYYFGASFVSDAFFVAFRIPNSFRRLLGEGGFNPAFVPLYVKALEEGRGERFLGKVLPLYVAVASFIALAGSLGSDVIVPLIAPGVSGTPSGELAVFMARFLFLYLILVGLSALFMGVLNAHGRFFVPAFSQAVFNGVFALVLILLAESLGNEALIVGVLAGGLFQVLVNFPSLLSAKVKVKLSLSIDGEVRTLLSRIVPSLAGFGVGQVSIIVDTFLASFVGTGAISYLYYAGRLYQLPFGVFSVGVANSLLTVLSGKGSDKRRELTDAFRIVFLFMIPASAGLICLSESIVKVIYGRGSFTEEDVAKTSLVLSVYSFGLVFLSLQKVMSSYFFAKGDTRTPLKATLITLVSEASIASSLLFIAGAGLISIPVGTASSPILGFLYLLLKAESRPHMRPLASSLLKTSISAGVMVLFLETAKDFISDPLPEVLILVPSGAFLYFFLLLLLRDTLFLSLLKGFVEKLVKS